MFMGLSSKIYPLEAGDLKCLPDCTKEEAASFPEIGDGIAILIEKGKQDRLLKGRELIDSLDGRESVPVRVAFVPTVPKYFIFPNFIRVLRNKFRFVSSNIYHISPFKLRELGIERTVRDRSNAYRLNQVHHEEEWCARRFEDLCMKLKTNGYDDSKPMSVMICRQGGMLDSLRQGHHRISACIECGVDRASIRFAAAGYMPRAIAGFFKNWKGKSINPKSAE